MPIRSGGKAPYAPPDTVLTLIRTYRGRGLQTPFTADVLARAGVPDTLVVRVTQSLKLLDLIDESLNPTQEFEALRRVGDADFPARLGALIRSAYAEVFQFVDPATDGEQRVRDSFRAFEPLGQLTRMVTLFMGLCEAAGIIPEGTRKAVAARPASPRTGKRSAAATPASNKSVKGSGSAGATSISGVDPLLAAVLQKLPATGIWTKGDRSAWLAYFTTTLDFVVRVGEPGVETDDEAEDE